MSIPNDPWLKWPIPERFKRKHNIEYLLEYFCEPKQLELFGDEDERTTEFLSTIIPPGGYKDA